MIKSQHYLEQWVEGAIAEGERDWTARQDKGKIYADIARHPQYQRVEGYCQRCKDARLFRGRKATNKYGVDTTGQPYITDDWARERCVAYYIGRCRCGSVITKRITHKRLDDYFRRTKKIIRDRARYRLDTLQPNDEGYVAMYGSWQDQLQSGNIHNIKTEEDIYDTTNQ